MNWGSIWHVLSIAAPVIVGVVGFIVLVLRVRALTLQNKKLAEELLKLSAERQEREGVIEIASRDDILKLLGKSFGKETDSAAAQLTISSLTRLIAVRQIWLAVLFVLVFAVLGFWLGVTWGR